MQDELTTPTSTRRRRALLWIAVGALAAIGMLGTTSAALGVVGTTIHQAVPISSDSAGFQGDEEECEGAAAPGEVLWHFVLTKTEAASATLTATFASGVVNQPSAVKTGKTLHFFITTGSPDTLLNATTDAVGKNLNLSHICGGGEETTTTTETTTHTETTATAT